MNVEIDKIAELPGIVATVCTTGSVKPLFSHNLSNLRDWNSRNGLTKIEYKNFEAKLVEAGRDAVCEHALKENYSWLLMIDADAGPFPQDALARMLWNAFVTKPAIDVLGAYAQLKQAPYLPVIDTGTGKWEPHFPGMGVVEVIRTGGHFIMVKTAILRRLAKPWFRTRLPYSPAKAFMELDNFARCTLNGKNPFLDNPEWDTLLAQAIQASEPDASTHIGEDSGFCDYVKSINGVIAVDTDIVAGHIADKVIRPEDLKEALLKDTHKSYAAMGVLGYD